MFSPYYGWARRGGRIATVDPENHCALNVALYGDAGKRWTMTERARRHVHRSAHEFVIGPSGLGWDGNALTIHINERGMPLPHPVRGTVRVHPSALSTFSTALDDGGRHRWGPLAAVSEVEVEFEQPRMRWRGQAYFDSNEGDEPIDRPFTEWDWARAPLKDGRTAVVYDVRQKSDAASEATLAAKADGKSGVAADRIPGSNRVLALRFAPDGSVSEFDAPPRRPLPPTRWRLHPCMPSDAGAPLVRRQVLEDTPFYARALLEAQLAGEPVLAMHETLDVRRLTMPVVQSLLPWRMPRRR